MTLRLVPMRAAPTPCSLQNTLEHFQPILEGARSGQVPESPGSTWSRCLSASSFKLARSWICHLVALSAGTNPSALTPRLGHQSASTRVEFHSSPCLPFSFPSSSGIHLSCG